MKTDTSHKVKFRGNNMEQKKVISMETIRGIERGERNGFIFVICVFVFTAVLLLFVAPFAGIIVSVIFAVIIFLIAKHRKKKGALQVYFVKRPITEKFEQSSYDEDNNQTIHYYFGFGTQSSSVFKKVYDSKNVGDMYYVMYDAYNNRIREIYDVDEYALAANLDVRTLPLP